MCGISGIVGRIEPGDRERIERASGAQAHRGPDDHGLWQYQSDDGAFGAVIGHRRLAIIDLRHCAAQPMIDPATGASLLFNGEIYNFKDLRAELAAAGERFETEGDSEAILRGYLRWGDEVVRRLRGMFAFVLVDPSRDRALFARDGFGIKPLYMTPVRDAAGEVRATAFASEGRALVAAGYARPRTDPTRLHHYLWSGFSIGPTTIWSDIDELPRGSTAALDRTTRSIAPVRFWRPSRGQGPQRASAAEMLEESVRLHLVSDVPKVVFLSGGVDSSAVVGLACPHEPQLETMSLGFAEAAYDESVQAAAIAAKAGTRHHTVTYSAAEMLAVVDRAIAALDQPTFDGINTWLVSRAAAGLGFKVGLSGAGGDELTGGYTTFRRLPRLMRALAGPGGTIAPAAARLLALAAPGRAEQRKLVDLAASHGDPVRLYQTQYAMRSEAATRALMREAPAPGTARGLSEARAVELAHAIEGLSPLRAITVLEDELFLGDRLLRDSDTVSMDNSFELRVPFVDTVLSDGFDTLSDAERYEPLGSKPPIRAAAYAIAGRALIDRPKRGFELPIEHWLRGELKRVAEETLLDPAACTALGLDAGEVARTWRRFLGSDRVYWTRIWTLFVLLRWAGINGIALG